MHTSMHTGTSCSRAICFVLLLFGSMPVFAGGGATPAADASPSARAPFLGGFLRETRIVYPLRVGEWEAKGEKRYEPQEMGASVRYAAAASDGWLDVFFYPAGVLSSDAFALAAEGERDSLRQARLESGDPEPELGPLHSFIVRFPGTDQRDPVKGYSLDMSTRRSDADYVSAMTLSLDRLYFVKARFSVAKGRKSRRGARKTVEAFMTRLVPMLTITSTGDCWMPLPRQLLAEGAALPEGTSDLTVDSRPVMVSVPEDRVLLAVAQAGRLLRGCDGAEPANPEVDEGMRELRIEYRAPAERGRGDTILPGRIELGLRGSRTAPQASAIAALSLIAAIG